METNEIALGFALGFIAGEGSFTGDRVRPVLSVRVIAEDWGSLVCLQRVFGGDLHGPYPAKPPRQPTAVWVLQGPALRRALPIFRAHLPSATRKRGQFNEWCLRWKEYLSKPT